MATYRNNKTGETIESNLSIRDAFETFLTTAEGQDPNNWMHFWLHKYAVAARAEQTTGGNTRGAIQYLCDSFVLAIGYGLKKPMLRVHYGDRRFKIYLSDRGTLCLRSGRLTAEGTADPEGNEEYVGCFLRGRFMQAKQGGTPSGYQPTHFRRGRMYGRPVYDREAEANRPLRPLTETEQRFLDELAKDVIGFLARCSKDMSRCCYCNLPLEDPRSKEVGYGATCAKHWGLPWGKDKAYLEKAPSFAKVHGETASGLCDGIRDNPGEEFRWDAFAEWLEEQGLPRVKMPTKKVTLPRNDSGKGNAHARTVAAPSAARQTTTPVPLDPAAFAPPAAVAEPVAEQPTATVPHPWTLHNGVYAAELSELPKADKPCPTCGKTIMRSQQTKEIVSYGDVEGWEFAHPCGAKLLVIND